MIDLTHISDIDHILSKVLKHFKIIRYQAKFSTLVNRHLNILIIMIARKSRDQKFIITLSLV